MQQVTDKTEPDDLGLKLRSSLPQVFPANPSRDTECFRIALEEWKRDNDCPDASFNDLPLEVRSQILRRANELKFECRQSTAEMPVLLTQKQVCSILKVSPKTLQLLRKAGKIPHLSLGYRTIRFRALEIQSILEKRGRI